MEDVVKTTLNLPDSLLSQAMKVSNCKTKTAVIVRALEQLVRSEKLSLLRASRGAMPGLKIDLDTLRARQ